MQNKFIKVGNISKPKIVKISMASISFDVSRTSTPPGTKFAKSKLSPKLKF